MKWINRKDEMPNIGETVLVWVIDKNNGYNFMIKTKIMPGGFRTEVTHWMRIDAPKCRSIEEKFSRTD